MGPSRIVGPPVVKDEAGRVVSPSVVVRLVVSVVVGLKNLFFPYPAQFPHLSVVAAFVLQYSVGCVHLTVSRLGSVVVFVHLAVTVVSGSLVVIGGLVHRLVLGVVALSVVVVLAVAVVGLLLVVGSPEVVTRYVGKPNETVIGVSVVVLLVVARSVVVVLAVVLSVGALSVVVNRSVVVLSAVVLLVVALSVVVGLDVVLSAVVGRTVALSVVVGRPVVDVMLLIVVSAVVGLVVAILAVVPLAVVVLVVLSATVVIVTTVILLVVGVGVVSVPAKPASKNLAIFSLSLLFLSKIPLPSSFSNSFCSSVPNSSSILSIVSPRCFAISSTSACSNSFLKSPSIVSIPPWNL